MGILLCLFLIVYTTAKWNAPILVEYVVEQTLVQKCSPETDPDSVRNRFRELLANYPDRSDRTDLLFRIAGRLEKVQTLSPRDLDELFDSKY